MSADATEASLDTTRQSCQKWRTDDLCPGPRLVEHCRLRANCQAGRRTAPPTSRPQVPPSQPKQHPATETPAINHTTFSYYRYTKTVLYLYTFSKSLLITKHDIIRYNILVDKGCTPKNIAQQEEEIYMQGEDDNISGSHIEYFVVNSYEKIRLQQHKVTEYRRGFDSSCRELETERLLLL